MSNAPQSLNRTTRTGPNADSLISEARAASTAMMEAAKNLRKLPEDAPASDRTAAETELRTARERHHLSNTAAANSGPFLIPSGAASQAQNTGTRLQIPVGADPAGQFAMLTLRDGTSILAWESPDRTRYWPVRARDAN